MAARYFNGEYDIIADLTMGQEFEFALNQGSGNYNNLSFQFNNFNIATTPETISADYPQGAALIMPKNSFAGMYWNDLLNITGLNAGMNSVGNFGTMMDPFGSGLKADTSIYTARADTSSDTYNGSTQDVVDNLEITATVAYATDPLSLAGDGVAHLIGQLS